MCKFIKIENIKKKIDGKLIALIPARKGSKSIKNKNLHKINGVPLINYTIVAAKKTKLINDIYVSSDSEEILNFSKKLKVLPIKRPKKYSMDDSSANEVVKHFISNTKIKKNDTIIYLQPTSPFRNHIDINKSIKIFIKNKQKPLVSVKKNKDICVYKTMFIKKYFLRTFFDEKKMTISRQKSPISYEVNGAIYIFKVKDFQKKNIFPIDKSIPFIMYGIKNLDVDEAKDLIILKKNADKL